MEKQIKKYFFVSLVSIFLASTIPGYGISLSQRDYGVLTIAPATAMYFFGGRTFRCVIRVGKKLAPSDAQKRRDFDYAITHGGRYPLYRDLSYRELAFHIVTSGALFYGSTRFAYYCIQQALNSN